MSHLILPLALALAVDLCAPAGSAPAPPAVATRVEQPAGVAPTAAPRGANAALPASSGAAEPRGGTRIGLALRPAPVNSAVPGRGPASPELPPAAPAGQDPPAPIQAILKQIRGADVGQLAVSEEDGRLLRVLVASSRAKRVLEIGGASGYSAIWIGLGLRETGGRLTTIEYDPGRAREAAANVRRAGLADIVQVVQGDAFKEIPKLAGTFDFVFLDAWKKDYKRFLDLVLPRLDAGGLFLAHNVVNKRDEMGDFLTAIQQSPALLTSIVTPSGEGVSISWKRR